MASKKTALSFLYATLVQGSADAFVQAAITTPFSGAGTIAGLIREILIEWPRGNLVSGGNQEIAVTRKTQAAMPVISDKSLVVKFKRATELATSGGIAVPSVERFTYGDAEAVGLIVVEPTIYAQFDSNGTTLTGTAYVRIGYEEVKLNEVDRLTIIANSLQA